jgi:hypothetical protein
MGITKFGREPIIDRDDDALDPVTQFSARRVGCIDASNGEPTPMKINQDRQVLFCIWIINSDTELRSIFPCDVHVPHLMHVGSAGHHGTEVFHFTEYAPWKAEGEFDNGIKKLDRKGHYVTRCAVLVLLKDKDIKVEEEDGSWYD